MVLSVQWASFVNNTDNKLELEQQYSHYWLEHWLRYQGRFGSNSPLKPFSFPYFLKLGPPGVFFDGFLWRMEQGNGTLQYSPIFIDIINITILFTTEPTPIFAQA